MKKTQFTSDIKSECPFCHSEVRLHYSEINNRWRDPSILDEELTFDEMIDRANNESPMLAACPICNKSWEEL